MKYRIVQNGYGFVIQYKLLGLFWCNYKFDTYNVENFPYALERSQRRCVYLESESYTFDTYKEAREWLNLIKTFPFKYLGHKIKFGMALGPEPVYIDASSVKTCKDEVWFYTKVFFNRFSDNFNELKTKITEYESEKLKEKQRLAKIRKDKKIIKVCYED